MAGRSGWSVWLVLREGQDGLYGWYISRSDIVSVAGTIGRSVWSV